ncbi:hypothetical protein F0L17_20780 [Streptomyces sp. TRM43335]|uniref:Uncharacterized protein n=1 Tax=Streptomyces taklimakanensis TaxID=2569853 RepID=A0A6G2BHG2_9ACTN|nr:hypothetical protein [Streptomyces taklimakanensis]MTE21503.1 hypothetical protein [Streptomyces taklimakanensis]
MRLIGRGWKKDFAKKFDACNRELGGLNGKLGEIGREMAALRETLAETADKPPPPSSPQTSDEELYKLREAVSTGTMILREENRELRRRQEKMLGDLRDLRLEVTGGRAGAHPPSTPAPVEAAETAEAVETDEADGAGSETGEAAVDPPSDPSNESPETPDDHRQEQYVEQQRDGDRRETEGGVPESPGGTGLHEETAKTSDEERVRAVKEAAERALRHRSPTCGADHATAPPDGNGPPSSDVHTAGDGGGRRPEDGRQASRDPLAEHAELLLTAAGVSRAELVCHRDTWEFLLVQAARHPRFRVPDSVESLEGGGVRTHLSGPSLIAALISLWETRGASSATVNADWALAAMFYDRIRARLVVAGPGDDRRTVRIVLDDGAEPEGEAAAEDDASEGPGASGKESDAA